jgi:glutamate-5-semialdehyde dehydrogenase
VSTPATDTIHAHCRAIAEAAAATKPQLRALSGADRTAILRDMAAALRAAEPDILTANQRDLAAGTDLSPALRDRLTLTPARLQAMAAAVEQIAAQPEPLGEIVEGRILPSGIRMEKRRVPIGLIVVIYESRPNVTSDAAALCFKSGNAVVLRGGKESIHSNLAIVRALRGPLERRGLADAVGFVDITDRSAIDALVSLEGLVDLAIPRGGPSLMKAVTAAARVPIVKHDAGNCHIYIDQHLDGLEEAAERITVNAKAQRPGVCNAAETLLVHERVAARMIPRLCAALAKANVEIRADEATRALYPSAKPATEEDWATEYLDLIIAIRIVPSLEEACTHIRRWGSQHTEAIMTSSIQSAERFITLVESASVMVNCSTRFADGGEYGLGAEIGISTAKLHARGPMGAKDLTTTQWVLVGSGQVRG